MEGFKNWLFRFAELLYKLNRLINIFGAGEQNRSIINIFFLGIFILTFLIFKYQFISKILSMKHIFLKKKCQSNLVV